MAHRIGREAGLTAVHNLGPGVLRRAEPGGSHLERGKDSPVGEDIDLQADTGYLAEGPREDTDCHVVEDNLEVEGIVPVGADIGQEEGTAEEVGRIGRDNPADRKDTTSAATDSLICYRCRYNIRWLGLGISCVPRPR